MSKPPTFRAEYIVVKRTSYRAATGSGQEGDLNVGRVVWLDSPAPAEAQPATVTAYVEPIGVVHLDPQCLRSSPALAQR